MASLPPNSSDISLSGQPPSGSLDRIQPQPGKHKLEDHTGGAREDYTTSQLCLKCRQVFDSWPSIVNAISKGEQCVEYAHWDNVDLFEEAASKGCHLCIHFFAQFSRDDIENAHRALGEDTVNRLYFTVMSTWNGGIADVKNWSLTLSLPLEEGLQLAYMGMTSTTPSEVQEVAPSTRDIACLKQAKGWLANCRNTHRGCIPMKKPQYPTRLIAVDQDIPRLVLSTELSGPGHYATLSHCWGELQILRLLKSNFESFRKSIPWEGLSQTFQDACFVAKDLGYDYIWIDSLCIIQDDAEDWAAESVLMSSVYGCSSLNIAASKAEDGSVGLFFPRNPKSVERIQLCLKSDIVEEGLPSSSGDSYCSGILYDCAPKDMWKNNVSKSVLGRRAWVLQERFLSPRTLFFSTQLFWTCGSMTACETFPESLPELFHESDEDYRTHNNSEHWLAIAGLYTACQLTFKKDRLIALSGIAETLQRRYDDEYVAGLWKKDLYRQLQWKFKDTQRVMQGKRPDPGPPFQAPSWSWAAVDGPVYWLPDRGTPKRRLYEILDVDMKPRRQNRYGDILSGILHLRCQYLVPFSLPKPSTSDLSGFEKTGSRHSKALLVSHPQKTKVFIGGRDIPDDAFFTWDFTERNDNQLYLLFAEEWILQTKGLTTVGGFVLQPQDKSARKYRRLATFDIYRTSFADWVEPLASCGIHLSDKTSFADSVERETTIRIV